MVWLLRAGEIMTVVTVENDVVIARSVDEVFDFVADQHNEPRWHTDILAIEPAPGSTEGLGSKWLVTVQFMGRNEYEVEVTGLEQNRLVEITTRTGPLRPTATYRFEPLNSGTRFIRRVDIPLEGGRRVMAPLVRRTMPRRNAGFVKNLKEVLER
jgi:uncharacterized membrane protein